MITRASTEQRSGFLKWTTAGYYLFGQDHWRDISISAVFKYKGQSFGMLPRYLSDTNYLFLSLENIEDADEGGVVKEKGSVQFKACVNGKEILLSQYKGMNPFVLDSLYTVTVHILRSNFQILVNDVLVINTEYGLFNRGNACLYGEAGVEAKSIEARSVLPDGWTTNVNAVKGAYVSATEFSNGDNYAELDNPTATPLFIEQEINVSSNSDYAISFLFAGEGKAYIKEVNGTNPKTKQLLLSSAQWGNEAMSVRTSTNCTRIKLSFEATNSKLKINNTQVEEGAFATDYIHNDSVQEVKTRNASVITYPAKDTITLNEGTLSFWFSPSIDYALYPTYESTLFAYGEGEHPFRICVKNGRIYVKYKSNTREVAYSKYPISKGSWAHIAVAWDEVLTEVYVNKEKTVLVDTLFQEASPLVRIGHSHLEPTNAFNGTIDDLIIYQKKINEADIFTISDATASIPDTAEMRLRATFDHAIGNFKKSSVDVPMAPLYGSPIIVEKADGTILRKVSFFHPLTGKYITYNEEAVFYDGFSDFIQVSYSDLDTTNFKVKVMSATGDLLGDPYEVEGNRIFLTLTAEEKEKLQGTPLYVQYQLEDSYIIDFNIEAADSFRVSLGKHDGQPLSIAYEGNRSSTEKLADMVELNPAINPYHDGFLYITNKLKPTSVFRTKASPNSLLADGYSESLLVIEPLDEDGNPVTNARLSVEAERGLVKPNFDVGSVRLREIAGRYLYCYTAPLIDEKTVNKGQVVDRIRIRDLKSGIGVQVNMTLIPITDQVLVILPDPVALEEEKIAATLLDYVLDYYKKPIHEIPIIEVPIVRALDFNDDGEINLDEVTWINEHLRMPELKETYFRLKDELRHIPEPVDPRKTII